MAVDADLAAIRALIARQFASLSWQAGGRPDWSTFRDDFLPHAQLFPSSRPIAPQDLDQFAARMDGLVGTSLRSFEETVLASRIEIFGNVAVAIVACENAANGGESERVVEMMLLVRQNGRWRIAAQAWDKEHDGQPIPPDLLARGGD